MNLNHYFKGIIDIDEKAIVICNLEHEIVYMNPAAVKQYQKRGGDYLIGKSLLNCHSERAREIIKRNLEMMKNDKTVNKIFETHSSDPNKNDDIYFVGIRDDSGELIGYYEKFEDKNLYSGN